MRLVWPWRCPMCAGWRVTKGCRPCQQKIAAAMFTKMLDAITGSVIAEGQAELERLHGKPAGYFSVDAIKQRAN